MTPTPKPILVLELVLAFWVFDSGSGDFDTADVELSDLVVEELERPEGADGAVRVAAEPSGNDVERSEEADGNDIINGGESDEADGYDIINGRVPSEDLERLNGTFISKRLLFPQHAAPCPLSQQYALYSEQ